MENFIFEMESLKFVPRSGWLRFGIKNPESVAEHSFMTAVIAFILAYKESGDIDKACRAGIAALFHDAHETRITDLHKLARRYVDVDYERLRSDIFNFDEGRVILSLLKENKEIVEDADKLELLVQEKIYLSSQFFGKKLNFKSKIAKELAENIKKADARWWEKLE